MTLAHQFQVSQDLISSIITEVCQAIFYALQRECMVVPTCNDDWKRVAERFSSHWNFSMCMGAIDGKRILLQKPPNTDSQFCDNKGHFSIILMALVDAQYKFIFIDVETNGLASNVSVWSRCRPEDISLSFPAPEILHEFVIRSPYILVRDDAFMLKPYLMKPYPGLDVPEDRSLKILSEFWLAGSRCSANQSGHHQSVWLK